MFFVDPNRVRKMPLCPSESGADAAAPAVDPLSAFGTLLASHVLRDGELVLLILRPSRWFILLSSLRFLAATAIFMAMAVIFDEKLHHASRQYVEIGVFIMGGRLGWGLMQWMSRLYVLTDMRILAIRGVFTIDIFDCPLRKVARTFLDTTFKEQLFRIGSISIVPQDEQMPIGVWRMIPTPRKIHQMIRATISRAKQGSSLR